MRDEDFVCERCGRTSLRPARVRRLITECARCRWYQHYRQPVDPIPAKAAHRAKYR